jgi:hypothetical protein
METIAIVVSAFSILICCASFWRMWRDDHPKRGF